MATARSEIAERLVQALTELFTRLESWREADMRTFLRQAVPLVRAAQLSMASAVAVQVATEASRATGRMVAPPAIPASAVTGLRGVDPRVVYARPFTTIYTALSQGRELTEAVELGTTRLTEIAHADLQQTYAHANREARTRLPANARPRYWRRVLQGEENCALCIVAASNRYSLEDLNPIHPGCDCTVAGVYGRDTEQDADDARLERVHQAIQELTGSSTRGGRAIDYRKLITKTHGELGPMLVNPRHDFTGPSEIPSS